ncbi:adenylate/guanylate cyclase domain-containing protein [Teredinibacter purpureus]|jgi:Adenylate cyclase, family 3 (some proteins contain HAMP domain)|uniref:adenylate/guanylate cyclase domain-containing protein n=1 Tax=Teredinibacter purpureus TaxID=2731756 RepID=UPI0005F7E800|nr:adenylate/guanylate cyclase domain-containing protein [Teredinibacter purpureus]
MTGPSPTIDPDIPIVEKNGYHAVLFADIVGSSAIYQELGNNLAQREIDRLMTLMIQVVHAHGGQLVKTIGDEIMVVFDDPECAGESSIALNLKMQDEKRAIRTGLAFGDLVFDGPDVFGNTVNRAASLVSAAQRKQILMDQTMYEEMPYWLLNYCELYDRLVLKGSETKALVYRLNWQQESHADLSITQVTGTHINSRTRFANEIEITINNESFFFTSADNPLTIGRDPAVAQCVIRNPKVSRLHGIISFHRGKFIYEDRSTNGSYLGEKQHPQVYLRRESAPLVRKGEITLGQPDADDNNVITFNHS